MTYVKGDIDELPNECGIYIGEIDLPSKSWYGKVVVHGNSTREVTSLVNRITEGLNRTEVEPKQELAPDYAAAFNMWLDDFVNSPQAYEDLHSTAIRHLTEKLNGEELSYGQICEHMLIEYLEKVK